jgi:hypothetical protein
MTYDALRRDLRLAYDRAADVRDGMADADWKPPERERFGDLLRRAGAAKVLEIGAGHGVSWSSAAPPADPCDGGAGTSP